MNDSKLLKLGVNIDHVATIRQARGTRYPEPLHAALIAEQHGADSITLHLREDRRHIQQRDVIMLKDMLNTRMNLEMAVTDEMIQFACDVKPADCCLVPERREELTTEGGLNVVAQTDKIKQVCQRLADAGIRVSLFIDANAQQIQAAAECGAPVIEIHTGHYADASSARAKYKEYEHIIQAVQTGTQLGLEVNAGHGLDYHNVHDIAVIRDVQELNIGHAIVSRAIFTGMAEAVSEMKRLMNVARGFA